MQVQINQQPLDFSLAANLGEVFDKIYQEIEPRGDVIISLKLDGQEIAEEEERNLRLESPERFASIIVETISSSALIERGIKDSVTILPHLREIIQAAADNLRWGKEAEGLKLYGSALELLSWFCELLRAIELTNPTAYQQLIVEGYPLSQIETNLKSRLGDMLEAQQKNDWILVADILEYELLELIDRWKKPLEVLREELSEVPPAERLT